MTGPASHDESHAALIARIAQRDRAALAELFQREAGRLLAVIRRIVRRTELAEDVVQETFVTVWEKADRFDAGMGSVRGWLTTIARNKALNVLRDSSRLEFHDGDGLAAIDDRARETDRAWLALPDGHALRQCLDRLDLQKRQSILLAYVAGFSHDEIAARMASPVGTVKSWIRRGTIALQECLS